MLIFLKRIFLSANILSNYVAYNLKRELHNLVLWAPVLQGAGILVYFSLSSEPNLVVTILIFLLVLSLFAVIVFYYRKYLILIIIIVLLFLGFISGIVKTKLTSTRTINQKIYAKNIIARVKEINKKDSYEQLLLSEVQNINEIDNIKVTVRTKVEENVDVGDRVMLSAVLFPPNIAPSEYSYDFARISYFQKISAVGFATSTVTLYQKANSKKFHEYIESFRQYIYSNLQRNMNKLHANITAALLIGKKDGIDKNVMNVIRNAGIAHLFVISGLHLAFVSNLFFFLFRNAFALSETITLKYNIKKISAIICIVPTIFYLLITGMQISAQRAFIMVTLVVTAILLERKYNSLTSIAFAAFGILLFQPESVLKPSFQMSFSAVLALIASYQISIEKLPTNKTIKYFISILLSSTVASLATMTYTIYNFNYVSIGGVVTNLVAIPIITLLTIPMGIIYVILIPFKFEWLISGAIEYSIDVVLKLSEKVANVKYSTIYVHSIYPEAVIIITIGLLWLCLCQRNWRFWGLIIIVIGIFTDVFYQTPDILAVSSNAAIQENDSLLYSLTKKNRNFISVTWAKQNGQLKALHYKNYNGENKRLSCDDFGCIYQNANKSVLIAYKQELIVQNCDKVDLILQLNKFVYPVCNTAVIRYDDLEIYGTHSIWLSSKKIKIKRIRSGRPWHLFGLNAFI
ncbi:ComEC/Rec2 family competence protein [Candidatus Mesenet endosymbiont of Agriotes lineatus]|uniref:ComEC/Rec2 family competence protein n=1 Tax=Candidatus Mesenet endosymbiont of Agriotes lineatus TaxID=3077948 RepID=UPI0030CFACAD